jgi:phosphatidylglycerol:prolipoprotein diacylglycerol transferase
MRPTLFSFQLGGVHVSWSTYGTTLVLGFFVALLIGRRAARRAGVSEGEVTRLFVWVIPASLGGANLLYNLTNPHLAWSSGLVWYGGLIGALLAGVVYCARHRVSWFAMADVFCLATPVGYAIGRLGCFSAGCCYGKPTASAIGVQFPAGSQAFADHVVRGTIAPAATATPPLHPTQLYEAAAGVALFAVLWLVLRRRRYPGRVALAYLFLYPVIRAVFEIFRADPDRRMLLTIVTPRLSGWLGLPAHEPTFLSTSQAVGAGLALVALGLTLYLKRRRARA